MHAATENLECQELLEVATPHLYRRNLFRVLGLAVTAAPADVRRQQKRLEIQRKLGVAKSNDNGSPLSLEPPPDGQQILAAMDRLNDPQARLLDEVFWFWPSNQDAETDPALKAIENGKVTQAAEIWTQQANQNAESALATHNIAVLNHLVALDREADLALQKSGIKQGKELSEAWCEALAFWAKTLEGEDFWIRVKDRLREFNDARLTTGFVRRLRSTLPKALLLINAQIAVSAAERGDVEHAARHARILHEPEFANGLADEVLREALKPTCYRVKAACDGAESKAAKDPEHADDATWGVLKDTEPLLGIVDAVLPSNDRICQGLRDAIATTALGTQISYGNKTEDWGQSLKLLEATLQMAASASLRERIERNLEIVRKNREIDCCYFCGTKKGVAKRAITIPMHGDVYRVGNTIHWTHRKVVVPRCSSCWWIGVIHRTSSVVLSLVFLLLYIVGMIATSLLIGHRLPSPPGPYTFYVILNVAAWVVIPMILVRALDKENFKLISELFSSPGVRGDSTGFGCLIMLAVLLCASPCILAVISMKHIIGWLRGIPMKSPKESVLVKELLTSGWKLGERP